MSTKIRLKRVYDPAEDGDGYRVLVDRIWPRGLAKAKAGIDQWMKEIAPTTELRKWFGHDPARWNEFRDRYTAELEDKPDLLDELRARARRGPVTLLYAAHDPDHNNAVVLAERLGRFGKAGDSD